MFIVIDRFVNITEFNCVFERAIDVKSIPLLIGFERNNLKLYKFFNVDDNMLIFACIGMKSYCRKC